MRCRKSTVMATLVASLLFLSGCNLGRQSEPTPDVGMIFTEAAQTVAAQFFGQQTQTALAVPSATQPPTITSIPTFAVMGSPAAPLTMPLSPLGTPVGTSSVLGTPTPLGALATQAGPQCNDSAFIADVNYPDGEEVKGSKLIKKVWRVQNTGTCTWDDGYALVHVAGHSLYGKTYEIKLKKDFVESGATVDLGIEMITPSKLGEYGGCWRMRGDNGYYFGTFLCIKINVVK